MSEDTRVFSREIHRAKPIRGGTWKCPHCDNRRLPGSAYCREHKQAYDQSWRAKRSRELKELRARATQPLDGDALSGS